MRHAATLYGALLVCLHALASPAHAEGLKEVRLYPSAEYTRLVFESAMLPPYRMSILGNPARLVLDVYFTAGDENLAAILNRDLSGASYLNNIRAARFDKDKLRVVFDLADEVSYSLFSLAPFEDYGHRVVLDVSPRNLDGQNAGLLSDLGFSGQASKQFADPPPRSERGLQDFVIVIDAGHGGEDPGAINKKGVREKHIVLDVASRLHALLGDSAGIDAFLTRDSDVFLPLASRVRIAHRHEADLFLSLHADSFTNSRPRGSSVFVLSRKGASSKLARKLAEQENLADMVGGINTSGAHTVAIDKSLTGLFQDGRDRASRQCAMLVKQSLSEINATHGENIHSAGFAVLKSPSIPSVLVELGFLSNPADADLLGQKGFRQRIAEQLAAAIIHYRNNEVATANN